jgi:hypothetical protein
MMQYLFLSFGGSKRSTEYKIAYAHLSCYMTDQKDLKLCSMQHCHLFFDKKDPRFSTVDPKVIGDVK